MKWKRFLPSTNFPTSAHDPSAVDPLAQAFYFHGSCPLQRWLKANHIFAANTPENLSNFIVCLLTLPRSVPPAVYL